MCGDSTDIEQVKMLMGGVLADMVFTDPPYGVSYTEKNEYLNSLGAGHRLTKAIENDSKTPTEMYDFWLKAFRVLYEVTNEKMAYYITAPQGGDLLLLLLLQAVRDAGFALKHQLIWNKNNHILGRCDYNYKHEPIIYGWKIKGTHDFVGGGKFKTSVWDIPKPLRNDLHPTMKPIELVAECLKDNTREGNVVIDVFGGSGTTLIAAEQLNRKAFLMEFDEHYCDVIIARWEKLTGKKAERITHA
jgi:DNA modification methylase